MNTDKLAIYWQNFARFRLQLKFALKARVHCFSMHVLMNKCFYP